MSDSALSSDLVDRTDEHLWMLSVLHYATAGTTALFGSIPLLHVAMGAFLALMPDSMRGAGPNTFPRAAGFMFMGMGLAFVAAGWSVAAAHFFTARSLRQRRRYWFCVVVSALSCFLCMLTSGVVGIASLIVLLRPGVRDRFAVSGARSGGTQVP